eukprot:7850441-Alexandrium_andersonii.AAC.1
MHTASARACASEALCATLPQHQGHGITVWRTTATAVSTANAGSWHFTLQSPTVKSPRHNVGA